MYREKTLKRFTPQLSQVALIPHFLYSHQHIHAPPFYNNHNSVLSF